MSPPWTMSMTTGTVNYTRLIPAQTYCSSILLNLEKKSKRDSSASFGGEEGRVRDFLIMT